MLAGRGLYQCNRCKKQTSPTAGTIFHATKLPLTVWFAAIHLIVTAKNGISSVELGRRLGVKQPTAWAVKHKIMAVMARREGETALTGRVEMDDAYLGGVRSGGKRGRGAAGKTPFRRHGPGCSTETRSAPCWRDEAWRRSRASACARSRDATIALSPPPARREYDRMGQGCIAVHWTKSASGPSGGQSYVLLRQADRPVRMASSQIGPVNTTMGIAESPITGNASRDRSARSHDREAIAPKCACPAVAGDYQLANEWRQAHFDR